MSAVLDRLVEHMERQRALRESVISATIYPAILLGVAVLSLIAMLGFVVPQFEKLFTDMGDALPLPTRIVMEMGHAFRQYGLVMGVLAALAVVLLLRWFKSPQGRLWWQTRLLRLPLVGRLALKYQLTLYARSLGTLLGNGVPLLTALHIATETVGNTLLRQALAKVAPIVKEGGKVVQAITATGIFEPLAINLIRVGEETGRVGSMMLELSNILNREVETGIKRLLTLVEPVLILVLGVLIAAIIVSILLGILSINDLAV
jgi:general secretion pathway protein F